MTKNIFENINDALDDIYNMDSVFDKRTVQTKDDRVCDVKAFIEELKIEFDKIDLFAIDIHNLEEKVNFFENQYKILKKVYKKKCEKVKELEEKLKCQTQD